MSYTKPLPVIDKWNKPFWDACAEKRLVMQCCNDTGTYWFPPSPVSPVTCKKNWSWKDVSGRGTIISYVTMHQKYFAGFADEVPYPVVQVELEEGPVMISSLVKEDEQQIAVGLPVQVVFEKVTDTISLPKFAIVREDAA